MKQHHSVCSLIKKTFICGVLGALLIALPATAQLEFFGYTQVEAEGVIETVTALGLQTNFGSLIYGEANWQTLNTASILTRFEAAGGVKASVSIAGFLFEPVEAPGSPCAWRDLDGDGQGDEFETRLRADWIERFDLWWQTHGDQLDPTPGAGPLVLVVQEGPVAVVAIHEEVNNECVDLGDVELLSNRLRAVAPDLKQAMAWGRTHVEGGPQAQAAPDYIPQEIDWLGIWSYGIYDPNDPTHPKNANQDFYNPEFPLDRSTDYGYLLAHKWPHQKVVLVFDAHFQDRPDGVHQVLGWTHDDLADLVKNYWQFANLHPEIIALYGFTWGSAPNSFTGLGDLVAQSQDVLWAHRLVSCWINGFCFQ
jgi:hypothetical protein